jgi:hypothetical protein
MRQRRRGREGLGGTRLGRRDASQKGPSAHKRVSQRVSVAGRGDCGTPRKNSEELAEENAPLKCWVIDRDWQIAVLRNSDAYPILSTLSPINLSTGSAFFNEGVYALVNVFLGFVVRVPQLA